MWRLNAERPKAMEWIGLRHDRWLRGCDRIFPLSDGQEMRYWLLLQTGDPIKNPSPTGEGQGSDRVIGGYLDRPANQSRSGMASTGSA